MLLNISFNWRSQHKIKVKYHKIWKMNMEYLKSKYKVTFLSPESMNDAVPQRWIITILAFKYQFL